MSEESGDDDGTERADGVFTVYGIASTVLGVVAVAAIVLGGLIWSNHRADAEERHYQSRVMQAAADWSSVLINMDKDTVESSLRTLHQGTVGQLNADFESVVEPFRQLVGRLQSRTKGQVDSVSIESIHHEPPGSGPGTGSGPKQDLSAFTDRTDTVLVVATSISENAGNEEPQTVRWNLRLDVSEVDGKLLISRLEPIR